MQQVRIQIKLIMYKESLIKCFMGKEKSSSK